MKCALVAGALLALALVLRVPYLGAVPNPSGDEGNWTWQAFDLFHGRVAVLEPDARFVSRAFSWCIAGAYALGGPSFASARSAGVLAVASALLFSWWIGFVTGYRRAGLAIALVLAVHPWSVLWSRTATVPYALALALGTLGPWLFFVARERAVTYVHRAWWLAAAVQCPFVALHFTPLALVPLGVFAVCALRDRTVRTRTVFASVLVGIAHTAPVLAGTLHVARHAASRQVHFVDHLGARLATFARTTLGGLGGEATVRHFTSVPFGPAGEATVIACVLFVLGIATRIALEHTSSRARPLARFALGYLLAAFVALPLLLAPTRPWNLPAIDAERYVFVLVAPFALVLGAMAERGGAAATGAFAMVAYFACGPTWRIGYALLHGGGEDRGFYVQAGGSGYRGWKVARERVALPVLVRDAIDGIAHGAPVTVLVADYAFHTLHFANAETAYRTVDVTKFARPHRPGERFVFVSWSDGLFAPARFDDGALRAERTLRRVRDTEFDAVARFATFVQPDGSPLIELWTGIDRVTSERRPPLLPSPATP